MMLHVFVLRDIKADVFGSPVFVASVGGFIRDLQDQVNSPNSDSMLYKHPADFHLMKLGSFDNVKGSFDLLPLPDFVLDCGSLAVGQGGSEATVAPVAVVPAQALNS